VTEDPRISKIRAAIDDGNRDHPSLVVHRIQAILDSAPPAPRVSSSSAMVRQFHEAFGVAVDAEDTPELRRFRTCLIGEESDEVYRALFPWDRDPAPLEDVAKELADLIYVVHGTAVSLGIDLDEAVRRVHASNMSKRNPDGTVSYRDDGKVLKPATYRPPDMAGVVQASEDRATTHRCPDDGKAPSDLPPTDRITTNPDLVTCQALADRGEPDQ
jgi:predicted HAD superfamily Cof-like phosphohydrolase